MKKEVKKPETKTVVYLPTFHSHGNQSPDLSKYGIPVFENQEKKEEKKPEKKPKKDAKPDPNHWKNAFNLKEAEGDDKAEEEAAKKAAEEAAEKERQEREFIKHQIMMQHYYGYNPHYYPQQFAPLPVVAAPVKAAAPAAKAAPKGGKQPWVVNVKSSEEAMDELNTHPDNVNIVLFHNSDKDSTSWKKQVTDYKNQLSTIATAHPEVKFIDIDLKNKAFDAFAEHMQLDKDQVPAVIMLNKVRGVWMYGEDSIEKVRDLLPSFVEESDEKK